MKENRIVPFSIFSPSFMHKNSRLTEHQRKQVWQLRCAGSKIARLAEQFNVSRPMLATAVNNERSEAVNGVRPYGAAPFTRC
jgi:hypothetical protein